MTIDYQLTKIYKIISSQTNKIYIGSTCLKLLCSRMAHHKSNYKKWLIDKKKYISSFEIIKYNDAKIILIESYPCNSRDEKKAREQYWIDNMINNCNKNRADKKKYNPEYSKKYYEINKEKKNEYIKKNKEHITEYQKQYYGNNKDKAIKYYENNKDKIKEYNKNYYLNNKEI